MLIPAMDLVKKSADLYKDNFKLFFKLAVLVSLPSIITAILISGVSAVFTREGQEFFVMALYGLFFVCISVASYVIGIWFSIVKVRIVDARYQNKSIASIGSYIHSDKKLIWPVLLGSILAGLAILGGFVLLIIPGIIFSIWFAFVMYSIALDNQEAVASLSFSKKLVKGRWWGVLWRILVPAAFFIVATYIVQIPLTLILKSSDSVIIVVLVSAVSYAINILFAPFLVSAQVILYENLKATKPATDVVAASEKEVKEPPF